MNGYIFIFLIFTENLLNSDATLIFGDRKVNISFLLFSNHRTSTEHPQQVIYLDLNKKATNESSRKYFNYVQLKHNKRPTKEVTSENKPNYQMIQQNGHKPIRKKKLNYDARPNLKPDYHSRPNQNERPHKRVSVINNDEFNSGFEEDPFKDDEEWLRLEQSDQEKESLFDVVENTHRPVPTGWRILDFVRTNFGSAVAEMIGCPLASILSALIKPYLSNILYHITMGALAREMDMDVPELT